MVSELNERDIISAGVIITFAIAVFVMSRRLPTGPSDTPGPGVYPAFIAVCLFFLGIVQIIQSIVLDPREREGPELSLAALKRLTPPFIGLLMYILLLPVMGFLIGTSLFLLLLIRYSNITEYRISVPISVGVAITLQYVFGTLLRVPLPDGMIAITRLLAMLHARVVI